MKSGKQMYAVNSNINRLAPAKHWDHTRGRVRYLLLACATWSSRWTRWRNGKHWKQHRTV